MLIEQADSSFATELTSCDGADETIIALTQCTIPLSVLQQAPYSLSTLGVEINAKVSATNSYGTSEESEVGGGALMELVPDAPVDL